MIGNYLPRQCGIATFTTDLCGAISAEYGTARLLALPINDTEQEYDYPARVRWSLAQDDLTQYEEAAQFLNFNNIDMVCLQHEYGIFGGPAGSHILHLLRGLKMPVVTTHARAESSCAVARFIRPDHEACAPLSLSPT